MIQLIETDGIKLNKAREATQEELKAFISTQLATTLSDDVDFLRKINKLTFGLQSNQ